MEILASSMTCPCCRMIWAIIREPVKHRHLLAKSNRLTMKFHRDFAITVRYPTAGPGEPEHLIIPNLGLEFHGSNNHLNFNGPDIQHALRLAAKVCNRNASPEASGLGFSRRRPCMVDICLLESWLSTCAEHHVECSNVRTMPIQTQSNKRSLINHPIASQLLASLRLINVNRRCIEEFRDPLHQTHYVALSYVWGMPSQKTALTKDTYEAFQREGGIPPMSQVLEDVLIVAKRLEIEYFWCDVMCILQDDHEDKKANIANMAFVYSNAYLTLIAACGNDAEAGLFGVSRPRSHQPYVELKDIALLRPSSQPQFRPGLPIQSKWSNRAWTMQEAILSKRRLVFLEDQVCWSCVKSKWLEDLDIGQSSCEIDVKNSWRDTAGFNSPMMFHEFDLSNYHRMISDYCTRELTNDEDIADALRGIHSTLPFDTWHGVPHIGFEEGILQLGGACWDEELVRRPCHAPSWSWMAWKRPPTARSTTYERDKIDYATVQCYMFRYGRFEPICSWNNPPHGHCHYANEGPPELEEIPESVHLDKAKHVVFYAHCCHPRLEMQMLDSDGISLAPHSPAASREPKPRLILESHETGKYVNLDISPECLRWIGPLADPSHHYELAIMGFSQGSIYGMLLSSEGEIAIREAIMRFMFEYKPEDDSDSESDSDNEYEGPVYPASGMIGICEKVATEYKMIVLG